MKWVAQLYACIFGWGAKLRSCTRKYLPLCESPAGTVVWGISPTIPVLWGPKKLCKSVKVWRPIYSLIQTDVALPSMNRLRAIGRLGCSLMKLSTILAQVAPILFLSTLTLSSVELYYTMPNIVTCARVCCQNNADSMAMHTSYISLCWTMRGLQVSHHGVSTTFHFLPYPVVLTNIFQASKNLILSGKALSS